MTEDDSPKYINSPETDIYQKRLTLYGLHLAREAIREQQAVVILEGYTDLISMRRVGVRQVVASAGTSFTEEHARLLRRYTTNAVLLYDGDSAGAAASLRGAEVLLANGLDVKICTLPASQDPDEFARSQGREGVDRVLQTAVNLLDFKLTQMQTRGLLRTPGLKATAVRDLLGAVARMIDPLQQSFYVRDLAEKLQLEEPVLWQEVRKQERVQRTSLSQPAPAPAQESTEEKYFQTRRGAAELGLLDVMLKHPEMASIITRTLTFEEIGFEEIKTIFRQVELDLLDGRPIEAARYLAAVQTPFVATSLSQSFQRQATYGNPQKFAFDCIMIIRLAKVDDRIDELRQIMKDKQGSTPEVLKEYHDLVQERQRLLRTRTE